MAPLRNILAVASALLAPALAYPAIAPSTLTPRNTQNFTIYAASSEGDQAINGLVFALYRGLETDGYDLTGYLYNHESIPISIANDYNLQLNADSANLVTSLNNSVQVVLDAEGNVVGDVEGTQGFFIEQNGDLGYDFGQETTQDGFTACPYTGNLSPIQYTVGYVRSGTVNPAGCTGFKLHTTFYGD